MAAPRDAATPAAARTAATAWAAVAGAAVRTASASASARAASTAKAVPAGERHTRRMPASAIRRVTVGLVAVVALAGCSSGAEPSPLPEPSTTASESSSPTPTPPTMPAEAKGTSPAAAKAFVRHFFDVVNYAALSGDTDRLRALGTADCVSCDAIASNIERIYGAGGRVARANWKLTVISAVPKQPRLAPAFDLGVWQAPEEVIPSGHAEPKTYPGGRKPMTIYVVRQESAWRVSRLDEVPT